MDKYVKSGRAYRKWFPLLVLALCVLNGGVTAMFKSAQVMFGELQMCH